MTTGLLLAAFTSFLAANLIHNWFGLDPAILPSGVLVGLYLWRRRPGFLWAGALFIALPAFGFLKWSALADPGAFRPFLNHVALLLAAVLALLSVGASLAGGRQPRHRS